MAVGRTVNKGGEAMWILQFTLGCVLERVKGLTSAVETISRDEGLENTMFRVGYKPIVPPRTGAADCQRTNSLEVASEQRLERICIRFLAYFKCPCTANEHARRQYRQGD